MIDEIKRRLTESDMTPADLRIALDIIAEIIAEVEKESRKNE